jgi:hypothetical protein
MSLRELRWLVILVAAAVCAQDQPRAATEWIVPPQAGQIKILNRGTAASRVRVHVGAESLEVAVRAGETVSLPDGLWSGSPDSAIRVESAEPLQIASIAPGGGLTQDGSSGTLIGLQAGSRVRLVSGPLGSRATLQLFDARGRAVPGGKSSIEFVPFASREAALSRLFPSALIFADTRLEARVHTGSLDLTPSSNAALVAPAAVPGRAIESLSASSAMPGQRITLKLDSKTNLATLNNAAVLFDDGLIVPAPVRLQSGVATILVPYVPDEDQELGYRTGNCSVALIDGGKLTDGAPLVIDPLPDVEDPAGKFRTIVEQIAAASKGGLESQKQNASWAGTASGLQTVMDAFAAPLVEMAGRIAADGTAAVPLDATAREGDESVEVSGRLLGHLVALFQQLPPRRVKLTSTGAAKGTLAPGEKQAAAGPGPCLADLPHYKACLGLSESAPDEIAGWDNEEAYAVLRSAITVSPAYSLYKGKTVSPCNVNSRALSPIRVAASMSAFFLGLGLQCKLWPTKPVAFSAHPKPSPIPTGPSESTGNEGTEITLRLEPYWTPEFTVDDFLFTSYFNTVQNVADDLGAGVESIPCAPDYRKEFARLSGQMWKSARTQLLEAVRNAAAKIPPSTDATIYKCDLTALSPQDRTILVRRAARDNDQTARWGLEGLNGGSTKVLLSPVNENFPPEMFLEDVLGSNPAGTECRSGPARITLSMSGDRRPISRCVDVTVAPSEKRLAVSSHSIFTYGDEGPARETSYTPAKEVTTSAPFSAGSGNSKLSITQTAQNKWKMVQDVEGRDGNSISTTWNNIALNLTHRPGPRKIRATVASTITGTCQGLTVTLGASRQVKEGNNGCSAAWTLETSSDAGPVSTTLLDIRVSVLAGRGAGFGTGKGSITTEVEYIDP